MPAKDPLTQIEAGMRFLAAEMAIASMKEARAELSAVGASKAANAVARALKSVDGALRHARRLANDAKRANT